MSESELLQSEIIIKIEKLQSKLKTNQFVCIGLVLLVVYMIFKTSMPSGKDDLQCKSIATESVAIADSDGVVRMRLFGKDQIPMKALHGKPLARFGKDLAGITFYNREGQDVGELTFSGESTSGNLLNFSVDKYHQFPAFKLRYHEPVAGANKGEDFMVFSDRPDYDVTESFTVIDSIIKMGKGIAKNELLKYKASGGLGFDRVKLGRMDDQTVGLVLNDNKGRARIKIFIDSVNQPQFCILDTLGKIIKSANTIIPVK